MNHPPMEATEPMKQGIGDTAHISPPDIAISLPDIYPTGNTTEPPRDTPNHIAILPPYLPDIDTHTKPMKH